jgi:hypothetical protein
LRLVRAGEREIAQSDDILALQLYELQSKREGREDPLWRAKQGLILQCIHGEPKELLSVLLPVFAEALFDD